MVDEPFLDLAPHVIKQMRCGFETLKAEGMAIYVHRTRRTPSAPHGQQRLHPGERSPCDWTGHREPRSTAHFSGCMKPSTSADQGSVACGLPGGRDCCNLASASSCARGFSLAFAVPVAPALR